MKNQAFGIELEMTGITREEAAKVIAEYFGTREYYEGGTYSTRNIKDLEGRIWKVVSDSSIQAQKKVNGRYISTYESDYRVEVVSPKLEYKDILDVQEITRKLRQAGAKVNKSCGVHIHIDAANHNAKSLRNLINIMASKEDLIYKTLKINSERENHYCKKVRTQLVKDVNKKKPQTLDALADLWYSGSSTGRTHHYNGTRYHGLNLHNVWYRGTVEFRLFNGTLHAGKIKAYIQFCLAVSAQAIKQRSARPTKTQTTNKKYTFRTWLLRLGLIGDEFKTARLHLLKNLEGDIAWRYRNNRVAGQ